VKVKPSFPLATSTKLLSQQTTYYFLNTNLQRPVALKIIAAASPGGRNPADHIMTSIAHCVLYDLLHSADQKILFTGLLSLRITDFAYAIELNSERLLRIQVGAFSYFLRDFTISGTPFLHYAALVCDNPTLFRIVCERSNIYAIDHPERRRTAVFYALRNPNMSILQTLIDAKIDIDQCDGKGCSPLIYCLQMGNLRRAKYLLDNGASVHRTFSGKYVSALEVALRQRRTDYLRLLLPYAGNQVNYLHTDGSFPVHLCIECDFAAGLRLLDLETSAFNPNLVTSQRPHALHWLLNKSLENRAAPEMITALLSVKRLDLNAFDKEGNTPLIRAVRSLKTDLVKLLASDPRCDVNCYSRDGKTALFWAVSGRALEITKILIQCGALVNQPNREESWNGETPIFAAVATESLELLEVLLGAGGNPNQWYYRGKLPIHRAPEHSKVLARLSRGGDKRSLPEFAID
jgi:ankyrin repeat protein